MFGGSYDKALKIVFETNDKLIEEIMKYLNNMPKSLKEKSTFSNKVTSTDGEYVWNLLRTRNDVSLAVGNKQNDRIDYFSICLNRLDQDFIINKVNPSDKAMIGFVTFYMSDPKHSLKRIPLTYDILLKKLGNNYFVELSTRFNSNLDNNKEVLRTNGLEELLESINANNLYKIDINEYFPDINLKRKFH